MLFDCFFPQISSKKKSKDLGRISDLRKGEANAKPRVEPIDIIKESEVKIATKEVIFEGLLPEPNPTKSELNKLYSTVTDTAYEGGDEHEEILSMKRDYSDTDLQAKEFVHLTQESVDNQWENSEGVTPELQQIQSGHVSDPGMGPKTALSGSPVLKRSCSNIESKTRKPKKLASPTKSHSYTDLVNVGIDNNSFFRNQDSPLSAKSNCSADRVMLKKRSSSQVLPSRSRKVWWKLFLWSHRNLHNSSSFSKPSIPKSVSHHHQAGYSSDTLEPTQDLQKRKQKTMESGNQWVAFAMDYASPYDRINAWVNSIEETEPCAYNDGDDMDETEDDLVISTREVGESSGKNHSLHGSKKTADEVMQANHVIKSLNTLSSVAHISGMGLKVIPSISAFSSLRSINLSGNLLVQINPGSLPKGLHTLDLSRNKITTIEGLRELTRLRVLNLSYNRISRIGHGLSNYRQIKELYLSGNKISSIEGLHRLLKLTVLDLSFNKITTTKALGQLVANYNSILALNLIGNPIHYNIGEDQIKREVCSLLPHLTYLNKQAIKVQKAREAVPDSVVKAALGSGERRSGKRVNRSSGMSSMSRRGSQSPRNVGHQKSKAHKSSRNRHLSASPRN